MVRYNQKFVWQFFAGLFFLLFIPAKNWAQQLSAADSAKCIQLNKEAIDLIRSRDFESAKTSAVAALANTKTAFGAKSSCYAESLQRLGEIYLRLGNFTAAEPYLLDALTLKKTLQGDATADYAITLHLLGSMHYLNKKYDLAAPYFKKAMVIFKSTLGEQTDWYVSEVTNVIYCYEALGRFEEIPNLYIDLIAAKKKIYGATHLAYLANVNDLAIFYQNHGNTAAAKPLFEETVSAFRKTLADTTETFQTSLSNLGDFYDVVGDYPNAAHVYEELVRIKKRTVGDHHLAYAAVLHRLALIYDRLGKYPLAEDANKQVLEIRKRSLGERDSLYATSLNNLALVYNHMSKYELAEPLLLLACKIRADVQGKQSYEYANSLHNLASFYEEVGKYDLSERYYREALALKKMIGGEGEDYAATLVNFANYHKKLGLYHEAAKLYQSAVPILARTLGETHPNYANSLANWGILYIYLGNYVEAETLLKKSVLIIKQSLGDRHPDYLRVLNYLAGLYRTKGDFINAENTYKNVLAIAEREYGKTDQLYVGLTEGLANLYLIMSNYSLAETMLKDVLALKKNLLGEKHDSYAATLNILAIVYKNTRNFLAAEPLLMKALEIRKEVLGENHPDYAESLNSLAIFYSEMGKSELAISYFQKALAINKTVFGERNTTYANALNNLATLYQKIKKFELAEPMLLEAMKIHKTISGEHSEEYVNSVNNLLQLYFASGQQKKWAGLFDQAVKLQLQWQKVMLQKFSETEKEIYLDQNSILNDNYHSMVHYFKYKEINALYQATNARRGWLLTSKQQLSKLAYRSTDPNAQQLVDQWKKTNAQYAMALQLSPVKRTQMHINVDSIGQESAKLEKLLIAAFPELATTVDANTFTTRQVAERLKKGEAVVQWASFNFRRQSEWTDSVFYAAYIIRPTDTVPKFVTVFEERQLKQLLNGYHGNGNRGVTVKTTLAKAAVDEQLYQLIWKPILPYLGTSTKIYNLPDGLLHKISFPALSDSLNHKQLIDLYEIHQLLSIDELLKPSADDNQKNIALFGGANFDATIASVSGNANQPSYRNATSNDLKGFAYLPGTSTEVKRIAEEAKIKNWNSTAYLDIKANEENFKGMSGKDAPGILHVATHGFYFAPPVKPKRKSEWDVEIETKDFPLLRSGLVLSGVNRLWGKDNIGNQEDGVLTAQEIGNMDLWNTDLVTLSACQTALGDINRSEGVYGLQRAFKMAGVKKLLISLWEVPDAETAELMQLFYQHVFAGKSYYDALRDAQLLLKAKYKDPSKWAGFVLVGE